MLVSYMMTRWLFFKSGLAELYFGTDFNCGWDIYNFYNKIQPGRHPGSLILNGYNVDPKNWIRGSLTSFVKENMRSELRAREQRVRKIYNILLIYTMDILNIMIMWPIILLQFYIPVPYAYTKIGNKCGCVITQWLIHIINSPIKYCNDLKIFKNNLF